jgi:ribose transport system substrate-binding protein
LTAVFNSYILKNSPSLPRTRQIDAGLKETSMQPKGVRRSAATFAVFSGLLVLVGGCSEPTQKTESGGALAAAKGATTTKAPATVAAADSPADGSNLKRIIILENDDSPFWDAARAGLKDAERELKLKQAGLRATLDANDGSPSGQIQKLQQYGSQSDIVGIAVSAIDADNIAVVEELRKLQKKGVQVVTVDSDVSRDKFRDSRFAFIGTDNRVGGRECGACARGLLPDGGGYVTFVGRTGAQNAMERIEGFKEGAGAKFQSLDSMSDLNDKAKARDNVRNAIQNHKDKLRVLVGIWSYNAPAIADVVKELNRKKDFTVVTFDAEPIALQQIQGGLIDAMVVQNPYQMGYQGVRLLKALHEKDNKTIGEMLPNLGKPEGDLIDTGLKIVVPDAKSPLNREMFGPKTEFLTFDKFKSWLAQYSLEGS